MTQRTASSRESGVSRSSSKSNKMMKVPATYSSRRAPSQKNIFNEIERDEEDEKLTSEFPLEKDREGYTVLNMLMMNG